MSETTIPSSSSFPSSSSSSTTSPSPGSRLLPYNLTIVGGGPAGTAILLRALHLGFAHDLLSGKCRKELDLEGNSAGVCIIDNGPKSRFGGGKLQDYKINSNTNGAKFVSNLIHDRPNVIPPEIATGTELEQVGKTKLAQSLLEYRATTAPLDQIGMFLVEVGQLVLSLFDSYSQSSYFCSTEVIKLQQIQVKNQLLWRIYGHNVIDKSSIEIYSRYVVLATGGRQTLPKSLPNINSNKLYSSDYICTNKGIQELFERLKNSPRKRIVIIGGSHSAFSAAWICLNKLGWFKSSDSCGNGNGSSGSGNGSGSNNSTSMSNNHSIYIVHRHHIKVFYSCKRDAERDKYVNYEGVNKQGQIHPFSGLRGDAKALYRNIRAGIETRVRLLAVGSDGGNHQSLYSRLCEEAQVIVWACGYEASLSYSIVDSNDTPLPIYLKRGQVEVNDLAQVQIIHNPPPPPSSPAPAPAPLAAASVSPTPPLSSPTTTSLAGSTVSLQPLPSKDLNTPLAPQLGTPIPIVNLLATGLGFGLNVSGDTNLNSPSTLCKADGVAVYLKRAATLILSHVLGPKVFGAGLLTWEQHVVENVRRWNEQQALIRASLRSQDQNDSVDMNDESENNTSLLLSPGPLSPIHPSKSTKNRCSTPSGPLTTSPIRRQIRTASSGDISRNKSRERGPGGGGGGVGITNTSTIQKKILASPLTHQQKKNQDINSLKGQQNKNDNVGKNHSTEGDASDADPYDLYLSGLVDSIDPSENQQIAPLPGSGSQQFSPLVSPKQIRKGFISLDEGDDSSLAPPPYPLDEIREIRSSTTSVTTNTTASNQNKDEDTSPMKPHPFPVISVPLSTSAPITPRNPPLRSSNTSPIEKSHLPRSVSSGWVTPNQSETSPTRPSQPSQPSQPQQQQTPNKSSLDRVCRATFSSKPSARVNTIHLSATIPNPTAISLKSNNRLTQLKTTGGGGGPPSPILPTLKLSQTSSQSSQSSKSYHGNKFQPHPNQSQGQGRGQTQPQSHPQSQSQPQSQLQLQSQTQRSRTPTLTSLHGVKKLLIVKSSKIS